MQSSYQSLEPENGSSGVYVQLFVPVPCHSWKAGRRSAADSEGHQGERRAASREASVAHVLPLAALSDGLCCFQFTKGPLSVVAQACVTPTSHRPGRSSHASGFLSFLFFFFCFFCVFFFKCVCVCAFSWKVKHTEVLLMAIYTITGTKSLKRLAPTGILSLSLSL